MDDQNCVVLTQVAARNKDVRSAIFVLSIARTRRHPKSLKVFSIPSSQNRHIRVTDAFAIL